jgi:sarcosine oxidase/L-pipecolate oxidase
LTLEAIKEWEGWNRELAHSPSSGSRDDLDLPPGMTSQDRIYVNCGLYHIGDYSATATATATATGGGNGLSAFEKLSIENLGKVGLGKTQYMLDDRAEVERARADGYGNGVDPFRLTGSGRDIVSETNPGADAGTQSESGYSGYLDMIGGFVYADKACRFALHMAQRLGVKFVLDKQAGLFVRFVDGKQGKVVGIETADGQSHFAHTTVVACGGWTPSILPELDGLCETTAGSVTMIQIPLDSYAGIQIPSIISL